MSYAYYSDHRDPSRFSVQDIAKNEWRGEVTRSNDGKWESENGRVFDTRDEAAEDNDPGTPPSHQV
jgi:hypothetical protein